MWPMHKTTFQIHVSGRKPDVVVVHLQQGNKTQGVIVRRTAHSVWLPKRFLPKKNEKGAGQVLTTS
jgi:hypothetical protein